MFLFLMFVSFIGNAQQEEITKFIKTESVGGKLDFTEVAEQQAKGAYFIMFDNVLYNKKDFAIVMWAAKVKSLGITKLKTATQLWEECYSRKLTDPEKKALKKGFEIKLEN